MPRKSDAKTELAIALAGEATKPHVNQIRDDVASLSRMAARLQRLAELQCNGIERWDAQAGCRCASWTEEDQAKVDRQEAAIERSATEIAARYGAKIETGGDPRGYVLKLHLPSGRSNAMGGGFGIG